MRNIRFTAAFLALMVLWREIFASCTFDQPTTPLARSSPHYYHYMNGSGGSTDYISASVQSSNGCDQSSLVAQEYHEPCNHETTLYLSSCGGGCMIHLSPDNSQSTATLSQIGVKVNYNGHCAQFDDIFMVTAIQDSSGSILWSNYILLIKDGVTFANPEAQVEFRKQAFCNNYDFSTPTGGQQDTGMWFTFPASADKYFQLNKFNTGFDFCPQPSGEYSLEIVWPTPITQVPEIGSTAFTFDPATLILTARASQELMDSAGVDGYNGSVHFLLTFLGVSAAFSIDYRNCNSRLTWNVDPVLDPLGQAPDAGESPPFFDLVVSDIGTTRYQMNWNHDLAVCGGAQVNFSQITAEFSSDIDYIIGAVSGELFFDLTSLANRDTIPDTYMQPVTIVAEVYYVLHPDIKITTTFVVKEHDCRPQNTAPVFNAVHANFISSTPLTHTNFQVDLGIDPNMCLGTEFFELSGPATGGAYMLTTDAAIAGWSSSSANDLIITVTDTSSVDFDGKYSIRHTNGKSVETTELVICYISQPGWMYESTQVFPIEIVRQSLGSFTVSLEPYTITQESQCQNVEYRASARIDYQDPFTPGYATMTQNVVVFNDFHEYTAGFVPVDVEICYDCSVQAAYNIEFWMTVIDCELEDMTVIDPGYCPLTVTFPVFQEQYRWEHFQFLSQLRCEVDRYRVVIRDPNNLETVYHYEFDGVDWLIAQPSGESQIGSLGEKFITDHANNLIMIDSEEFRNFLVNDYYGDYQIEVQGGVGTNSPAAYFDPKMISCTISIVCVVQSLDVGEQEFKSLDLNLGEQLVYDVKNYTQFPACGYDIDYTLTLIERNSTDDQPQFQSSMEGWNTFPPFIHLLYENEFITLRIQPEYGYVLGKSYAVYINGNVNVNRTVQGPVTALNDYFDVTIPLPEVNFFENEPPLIPFYEDTIEIYPLGTNPEHDAKYEDNIYAVGFPVDRQFDQIYVSEWGMLGWSEEQGPAPPWIQFINETDSNVSQDGVRFKLTPSIEQIKQSFKLYFNLTDTNVENPMTQVYELTIHVLEVFNLEFTARNSRYEDERETLNVSIEPYESEVWRFKIIFSEFIYVPANYTGWDNDNEGSQKIQLEFRPNEDTQYYLEDTDTQIDVISWKVLPGAQNEADQAQGPDRSLQTQNERFQNQEKEVEVVEIDEIKVEISLTQRERVSYSSKDTVMISVKAEILSHDTRYKFSCNSSTHGEVAEPGKISNLESCYVSDELGLNFNLAYVLKLDQYVDQDEKAQIAMVEEATKNSLIAWFSANFLISFFSSGFLQFLWSMINTLQIVMLTLLFNLEFPDNATRIMGMIMQLCASDFTDTESFFNEVFGFRDTAVFQSDLDEEGEEHSVYANAGYDSSIFFILLGPILLMIVLYSILMLSKKLLQLATIKCSENFLTRRLRERSQYMLVVTRFLLESCLEIGLSAMICIFMIEAETFKDVWESISTISAFLSLLALLFAPFFLLRLTRKYLRDVKAADKEDLKHVQNAKLFDNYRLNQMALLYSTLFFLRRYVMLLILTLFPTFGLTQVFLQMASTMFIIAYLGRVMPYQSKAFNIMEIVNELVVLGATYPLLTFTDWVFSLQDRNFNGWFLVAYICFNIVFNITMALFFMIRKVFLRCKYMFVRRRKLALHRKLVKQAEERRKALLEEQQKKNEFLLTLFAKPHEHDIMKGRERDEPTVQAKMHANVRSVSKVTKSKGKFTQDIQLFSLLS